jgi:hypothetical protein
MITRSDWGARAPKGRNPIAAKSGGIVIHHTGSTTPVKSHWPGCWERWRGHQNYHMDRKGWLDIAYNHLVCPHGFHFEGRGWDSQNGANKPENGSTLSICWEGGMADTPGNAAVATINRLIAEAIPRGWARRVRGHGEVSTTGTDCPGNLRPLIADGRITLEAPTPPPSETPPDDAPADDVAILAAPTVTLPQLQRWATTTGATARYRELMLHVWHESTVYGVDPAVPAAIMDHETAGGHFGGVLGPEHHNWGGIKTTTGGDNDDPDAHARFPDDETGVRAVIQHAALYAGLWIPGELRVDPRHFDSIRGTARSLLSDGWRWAGPDHGPNVAAKVRRIRAT